MHNFPGPNRLSSLFIPVVIVLGIIFFINFIYNWITTDSYDDKTIMVEFHCPTVLSMKENYPSFIIIECKKLYER